MKSIFCSLALLAGLSAKAQVPFAAIDTSFTHIDLVIAGAPVRYDILFQAQDPVWLGEHPAKAKEKLDFMAYLPINGSSTHGYLWVNHETTGAHPVLGQGGGATILEIGLQGERWQQLTPARAVDFTAVGGTWNNCLGVQTPWGTVLSSEEYEPQSNEDLWEAGMRDTSQLFGRPAYLNFGWMVEVDVASGRVLGKRKAMGRFSHEGNLLMPDERTVYMLDDWAPGIFFKFVADTPRDFTAGQLFAFRQHAGGGTWLPLPRDEDSLADIRTVALRRGATFFMRPEDLVLANDGTIYFTETGKTEVDLAKALELGGHPAAHLASYRQGTRFSDIYGRILRFDPLANRVEVFLQAGPGLRTANHLANPDNLAYDTHRNLLYIHEDVNEADRGRVPAYAEGILYNELYVLDLSKTAPTIDDLQRLLVAPPGAELTGGCFTPDCHTFFVNIQHPLSTNPAPFDRDMTLAIYGKLPTVHKLGGPGDTRRKSPPVRQK
ncbi:MAG: DUF839 domain-containing protein [Bacteroidetes bacterium]|nr:DUF839 domain-containing protein [Bacteroidota bacterium]